MNRVVEGISCNNPVNHILFYSPTCRWKWVSWHRCRMEQKVSSSRKHYNPTIRNSAPSQGS